MSDQQVVNEITKQITIRLQRNIDHLSEKQAKQILKDLTEALVVLFVGTEPKLADPKIPAEEKAMPFFKAIGKLSMEAMEAHTLGRFFPDKLKAFENKIAKFKNLEQALTLLTK